MKALQYSAPGQVGLVDVDVPQPGPAEVLVKITGVTTCPHWDIHIMDGKPMFPGARLNYPYTVGQPGHEGMGIVVDRGPAVTDLAVGDRVVAWRDRGHDKPGCYAEFVAIACEDLLRVPEHVADRSVNSLELAMCVQVTMDRLAECGGVAGKRVAVGGLGPAGLVAVQMAKAAGAGTVIGIDPLAARRGLARRLGADTAAAPDAPELPAPRGSPSAYDIAIDCTGLNNVVQALMDRTRQAVALFGVLRDEVAYGFRHFGGLSLLGYGRHNRGAAERAMALIAAGKLDLAPLVSVALPFTRYREGIESLRTLQALKVLYVFDA